MNLWSGKNNNLVGWWGGGVLGGGGGIGQICGFWGVGFPISPVGKTLNSDFDDVTCFIFWSWPEKEDKLAGVGLFIFKEQSPANTVDMQNC